MKYAQYFCCTLVVSCSIFWGLYQGLESLKYDLDSQNSNTQVLNEKKILTPMEKIEIGIYASEIYTECMEKQKNTRDDYISYCEENKQDFIGQQSNIEVINNEEKTNYSIITIYVFLVIALNTQIALLVYTYREKNIIKEQFYHLSDWAINSPPILGVLGTIISFALLMEKTKYIPIEQAFTGGFFDAAITTVIGGAFYSANLFLKIFIHPNISKSPNRF